MDAPAGKHLGEPGLVSGDTDITRQGQVAATPGGHAVHRGDNRFFHAVDGQDCFTHGRSTIGYGLFQGLGFTVGELLNIAAGAEPFLCAGNNDHPHVIVFGRRL